MGTINIRSNGCYLQLILTRFFGVMPAYAEAAGGLGAKLVTFYAGNADNGVLSTHHAVVVLFEPATGVPLVVSNLINQTLISAQGHIACSIFAEKLILRSYVEVRVWFTAFLLC